MLTRIIAAAAAAVCLMAPARAQMPPDLAMVPVDAVGFVHIRAADIWKHDMMKSLRDVVAAAGPKALAALQAQVYPNPADLDRVTICVCLNAENPQREPDVTVIVAFKNAIDAEKIHKLYLPESGTNNLGGKKFYVDKDKDIGVYFPDAKIMVAGPAKAIESFVKKSPTKIHSPLYPALEVASTKAITIAANVSALPIPPKAFDEIPPDIRPLARVQSMLLTLDLGVADPVIELKATYPSEPEAVDAEKGLKAAVALAKRELAKPKDEMEKKLYANLDKGPQAMKDMAEVAGAFLAVGGINRLEEELDHLPITRAGRDMTAKVTIPAQVMNFSGASSSIMIGLLLPAVQKVRLAAGSSQSQNNLKQIGLAFHNSAGNFGNFPGSAICDKNGKPLLSWRVAILPYIEQGNLYSQFKLDEPWDSPNNKPLIEKMPKIYASPRFEGAKPGETVYKVFVGKDAVFGVKEGVRFADITDGTSNTIMAAEAGEPVIWTKPDDIPFDAAKALPKLELPGGIKLINVLFADGSVRRIDLEGFDMKMLKNLVQINDGNIVDLDGAPNPAPAAMPAQRLVPAPPIAPPPPKK